MNITVEAPMTEAFDTATAHAAQAVRFPSGMIGCPDWRVFSLAEHAELPGIYVLQSDAAADITFLLVHVTAIEPDYLASLHRDDAATLAALGAGQRDDVELFCTLNTHDPERITANLLGPLVVDRRH